MLCSCTQCAQWIMQSRISHAHLGLGCDSSLKIKSESFPWKQHRKEEMVTNYGFTMSKVLKCFYKFRHDDRQPLATHHLLLSQCALLTVSSSAIFPPFALCCLPLNLMFFSSFLEHKRNNYKQTNPNTLHIFNHFIIHEQKKELKSFSLLMFMCQRTFLVFNFYRQIEIFWWFKIILTISFVYAFICTTLDRPSRASVLVWVFLISHVYLVKSFILTPQTCGCVCEYNALKTWNRKSPKSPNHHVGASWGMLINLKFNSLFFTSLICIGAWSCKEMERVTWGGCQ